MNNKAFIPIIIMLSGVLTVGCTNNTISLSSGQNPENIAKALNSVEIETKTISDSTNEFESNISIPIFPENNKFLNELNILMEKEALNIKEEIHQMAKKDFNKNNLKYELNIEYKIHTLNPTFISLTMENYQYTGGAHGFSNKTPYNFDLTTGKEMSLQDLFKKNSNYKEVINKEIQKQIKEEPDKFFPDEVEVFSGINNKQPFYIEDGKLVIYFGLYEIAPYTAGIVEFQIPSSTLKNIASSPLIK